MSDPLNDMSLVPPPAEPLNVWPLDPVPLEHMPPTWTRQIRRRAPGQSELWQVTRAVRVYVPGLPLLAAEGPCWRTYPETPAAVAMIRLDAGHTYDGASGPAIDDPEALLGAAVHDVCVLRIDGKRVRAVGWCPRGCPQVCPCYLHRAMVYPAILRAQGESVARAVWSGLAVAAYDLVIEPWAWRARECK